ASDRRERSRRPHRSRQRKRASARPPRHTALGRARAARAAAATVGPARPGTRDPGAGPEPGESAPKGCVRGRRTRTSGAAAPPSPLAPHRLLSLGPQPQGLRARATGAQGLRDRQPDRPRWTGTGFATSRDMTVADVMTDAVVMVDPDEHLDVAELLMLLVESRHVPVVDQGALVGVISLRDLLAAQLPSTGATEDERWQHLKTLRAHEAMSRPPVVARLHDSIAQAAHRMLTHRISCLPVVDGEQLVGIVTSTDLVRCAVKRLRAQADSTGATPKIGQLMTPEPL